MKFRRSCFATTYEQAQAISITHSLVASVLDTQAPVYRARSIAPNSLARGRIPTMNIANDTRANR